LAKVSLTKIVYLTHRYRSFDCKSVRSSEAKMKCFIILSAGKHTSLICDTRLLNSVTVKMRNEGLKIKFTCCGNA